MVTQTNSILPPPPAESIEKKPTPVIRYLVIPDETVKLNDIIYEIIPDVINATTECSKCTESKHEIDLVYVMMRDMKLAIDNMRCELDELVCNFVEHKNQHKQYDMDQDKNFSTTPDLPATFFNNIGINEFYKNDSENVDDCDSACESACESACDKPDEDIINPNPLLDTETHTPNMDRSASDAQEDDGYMEK